MAMRNKLVITEPFVNDYKHIRSWIREEKKSPRAANRFENEVVRAMATIEDFPKLNNISRKPLFSEKGIREHIVLSYVITYEIEGNAVILHHLYHQRQDFGMHE